VGGLPLLNINSNMANIRHFEVLFELNYWAAG